MMDGKIENGNGIPNMQQHWMNEGYTNSYNGMRDTEKPVNCDTPMQVTNIYDLQKYSRGSVVRFPDFAEGQPFVARVRRPSMLVLAKQGKIPNNLLNAASQLFSEGSGGMDLDDERMLEQMYDLCHIICEASLVEPTIQQIEDAGMYLSDDQITAIFNYTQTGVKALESFRQQ